jgi:hypothetical protein
MKARATQLLTRYIGMGLMKVAVAFGVVVNQSDAEGYAAPIAIGVVGAVSWLASEMIHKLTHGSFLGDPKQGRG